MLEPQSRLSIYDIIRAPSGFLLDYLVATTYSASLATILSLPAAMLVDGVDLAKRPDGTVTATDLAALKRIADRTAIFCQSAAIHSAEHLSPAIIEAEDMVREVTAPNGGSFHPKVWIMRFRHESEKKTVLRLAVMSRNLTSDVSWDAGIVLDGKPSSNTRKSNDLGNLLRLLPDRCLHPLDRARKEMLKHIADEVETTKWKMPAGTGVPTFHAVGIAPDRQWRQPASERLAIISPFLSKSALSALTKTTASAPLIVSRADALQRCWPTVDRVFDRSMVLSAPGQPADGPRPAGLHAKILLWEIGSKTRIAIGSMNATTAAVSGRNVEFMVSFDCTSAIGVTGIDALLESRGMGAVLEDFEPEQDLPAPPEPFDDRPARAFLVAARLYLFCTCGDEGWVLDLRSSEPQIEIASILPGLRFRPATLSNSRYTPCHAELADGCPARLSGVLHLSEVTGFTVFEADMPDGPIAFVLNLEVRGVDADERRQAALKTLLPDYSSFSDFLRILLGDFTALGTTDGGGHVSGSSATPSRVGQSGILEALIRCSVDDPVRLHSIRTTLEKFRPEELKSVTSQEFRALWTTFVEMTDTTR